MPYQKIILGKIVDFGGSCHGPGPMIVKARVAQHLIAMHEAQPCEMVSDDDFFLMTCVPEDLTTAQRQHVAKLRKKLLGETVVDRVARAADIQVPDPDADLDATPSGIVVGPDALDGLDTQAPADDQPKKLGNGQVPAGFPARTKLGKLGLLSVAKLKASQPDDLKDLTPDERDQVAAELALLAD